MKDHLASILAHNKDGLALTMLEVNIAWGSAQDRLDPAECARCVGEVRRGNRDICFWGRATGSSCPGPLPCRSL